MLKVLKEKISILIVTLLLLGNASSYAQDIRFLIDDSGSMNDSDPESLRIPALQLVIHLLPNNSTAGIWSFSNKVKEIVPLSKVDSNWKKRAKLRIKNIQNSGQYTNLSKAINTISQDWYSKPATQDRIIVLLTDGKIDLSGSHGKNLDSKSNLLTKLIPKLIKNNITVYTIGLSKNVDQYILNQLAFQTNGTFQTLGDPRKLQDTYYQIFNTALDNNEIAVKNNAFVISKLINEFTLIIPKHSYFNTLIITPDGESYKKNKASSFKGKKYVFLTVKNPQSGKWLLKGIEGKNARIIIKSDLSLQAIRIKNHLFACEKIIASAYLKNRGLRVSDKKILNKTDISVNISNKVIKLNKPTAYEINYRKSLFIPKTIKGNLIAKYHAKNNDINLYKSQLVKVKQFPYQITFRRKNKVTVQVHVTTNSSTISKTNLKADIYYPSKTEAIYFKQYSPNKYFSKYIINCIGGQYTVKLNISGLKINGSPFIFKPITYKLDCRKRKKHLSYIEPINHSNLLMKESIKKQLNAKKIQQNRQNPLTYLIPAGITLLILVMVSLMFSFIFNRSRNKKTKNILNEFSQQTKDTQQDDKND